MGKQIEGIENSAMDMLMKYSWPGNVRELENSLERAMVSARGILLRKEDFLLNLSNEELEFGSSHSLAEVEKKHILNILENNNWNISVAAKLLQVDRSTIYKKLKRYGIERPQNA